MKKKQLRIYQKLARNLPEIIEGKADYRILIGHDRDEKGRLTGKKIVAYRKGIRVNHVRRIKRADLRDGVDGIIRYLDKVRKYELQTKQLQPLLENQKS